MPIFCSHCDFEIKPDWHTCTSCGRPIERALVVLESNLENENWSIKEGNLLVPVVRYSNKFGGEAVRCPSCLKRLGPGGTGPAGPTPGAGKIGTIAVQNRVEKYGLPPPGKGSLYRLLYKWLDERGLSGREVVMQCAPVRRLVCTGCGAAYYQRVDPNVVLDDLGLLHLTNNHREVVYAAGYSVQTR